MSGSRNNLNGSSSRRKASSGNLEAPPSPVNFPRTSSPLSFISKGTRWFRTTSAPKAPPPEASSSRQSLSTRRPTISGPTDPRPILAVPGPSLGASRSVLDLSAHSPLERIDDREPPASSDLGDLSTASRRTWSRSMDDLGCLNGNSNPSDTNATKAKIANYRKASGGPAPLAPPAVPFPSISRQASPSNTGLPSVSIPYSPSSPTFTLRVNAPESEEPSLIGPGAHIRTKSHGAHHPNNARPPLFVPPSSPVKKSEASPVHRRRGSGDKERERHPSFGFPFHFGPSSHQKQPPSPTDPHGPQLFRKEREHSNNSIDVKEAEVSLSPNRSANRNSQIIHLSGFLNRYTVPAKFKTTGLASEKNWKPCKAQLRGTKLHFYKSPADRANEIRELFLTGPPPVEVQTREPEPMMESEVPSGSSRSRLRERKRVYWGRARHAELVVSADGNVVSGPPDALIHELVFATTFAADKGKDEWKAYAEAILLCLPSQMEKKTFETELLRDVNSFVQGASDEERESHAGRLLWIMEEYAKIHSMVEPPEEWTTLLGELGGPAEASSGDHSTVSDVKTITAGSPPRLRPAAARGASGDSKGRSKLVAVLAEEGLTHELFSRTDPRRIMDSLGVFQRSRLPSDVRASDFLMEGSLLYGFSGSDEQPNWLTQQVIDMVLGQMGKGNPDDSINETSLRLGATLVRVAVVTKWIQVAERCRLAGDVCSFRSIQAGLCSVPVARLEKVWRRIEDGDRRIVEDWVKGEKTVSPADASTPWAGDVTQRVNLILGSIKLDESPEKYRVEPMRHAATLIQNTLTTWTLGARDQPIRQVSSDTNALVDYWARCFQDAAANVKPVNQLLSKSYAIEPRQRGRYEPYFWKPPSSYGATQSILPLLFPDPLPTISLLDRNALIKIKKETLLAPGVGEVSEVQVQKLAQANTKSTKAHGRMRNIAEADLEETLIPCFNGELVLKLPRDDPEARSRPVSFIDSSPLPSPSLPSPSLPSPSPSDTGKHVSRGNSIRLSPAGRLERKGSQRQIRMSRRSSLPSISQRSSLLIPEAPSAESSIRLIVKSGRMDRLVDVLVSGLEGVGVTHADDNGEMPLREGNSKSFKVDQIEFARIWWSTFRSFVTPLVLFELLRKRYIGGLLPGVSRTLAHGTFAPPSMHKAPFDGISGMQLQLDVLSTVRQWLTMGGGAQDVLDDDELYQAMKGFLSTAGTSAFPDVEKTREALLASFTTLTCRPPLETSASTSKDGTGVEVLGRPFGVQPPHIDQISADELVNNLDSIARSHVRTILEPHMFELFDIIEAQSADRTGWFIPRDSSSSASDDTVVIQNLYNHLQSVEPSPMLGSSTHHDHLHRLLNPSIRAVLRAHNVMRDWLLFKVADPTIGPAARLARAELLVDAVEVCRSKAFDGDPTAPEADSQPPAVRSFVESILVSAIISPESRMFARTWHEVASSRSTSVEDLVSLVPSIKPQLAVTRPLTIDPTWIMERIVEIVTLPDVTETEDGQGLVNLEKRRYIHNLVVNTTGLTSRAKRAIETERQDLERLAAMYRDIRQASYEFKVIRDAAGKEMAHTSVGMGSRRMQRPFYQLVALQQEKNRRDKYLRDKLLKEKRLEQSRAEKKANALNKAMQPHHKPPQPLKHVRQKRSVTNMYSLFRPLSAAFLGNADKHQSWDAEPRTAEELDFAVAAAKPALTLNLTGAGVTLFITEERPFTFQLDTEDGGRFILQALTQKERDNWMMWISKISSSSAQKRLTYGGPHQRPAFFNEAIDYSNSGPANPTGVFGHDLLAVLKRESPSGEYIPGSVPRTVNLLIDEIERRGLTEQGIYRIAGSKTAATALKADLDLGRPVDLSIDGPYPDIHISGDVLRQYFRDLPEPIFPEEMQPGFAEALAIPDYEEKLEQFKAQIWRLPSQNFGVLRRLMEHLNHVTDFEDHNQMHSQNLAICYQVTLCRPKFGNMHALSQATNLVKSCIDHYHFLFTPMEIDDTVLEETAEELAEDENSSEIESSSDDNPTLEGRPLAHASQPTASKTQSSFVTASEGYSHPDLHSFAT